MSIWLSLYPFLGYTRSRILGKEGGIAPPDKAGVSVVRKIAKFPGAPKKIKKRAYGNFRDGTVKLELVTP